MATIGVVSLQDNLDSLFINAAKRYDFRIGEVNHVEHHLGECDLLVFVGGEDVATSLYGEFRAGTSGPFEPSRRDMFELFMYRRALRAGIPMLGICRGAQFLAVMNGDSLWQDIERHPYNHKVTTTMAYGSDLTSFDVTSTHHQMIHHSAGTDVDYLDIARAHVGQVATKNEFEVHDNFNDEVEICFYYNTSSLCVQGHPEYLKYENPFPTFVRKLIKDYFNLEF